MHNLMTEPLIRYDCADGSRVSASLPEAFTALMTDAVEAFPALRPHQRHAWHAFLVQLGAMAMHRAGLDVPPQSPDEWVRIIRGLTPEWPDDEPWHLVMGDITQPGSAASLLHPAFMQPPARSTEQAKGYKSEISTPDELDMLVTSKDHDLKSAVAERSGVDDWILALITVQTMGGFDGAGNYGISRMNGGMGNRPAFSLAPAHGGPGAHVRRDIVSVLERRREILEAYTDYPDDDGIALVWILPWDGTAGEALSLRHLDVFYIEVCRRIRLRANIDGELSAVRSTSSAARIDAKTLNGLTGDPWAPIDHRDKKGSKVLSIARGGFHYRRIKDYLTSGEFGRPLLLRPSEAEGRSHDDMQLVARAIVRGQGKTEGYYERTVPIRPRVKSAMSRRAIDDDLASMAHLRVEQVAKVQRILSHAIQTFVARGDPESVSSEHGALARPWLDRLDDIVDEGFFDALQDEYEEDPAGRPDVHNRWLNRIVDHGRSLLLDATESLPCPAILKYKAEERALGLFEGRLRGNNGLPFLFDRANMEVKGDDDRIH